jgi:DNA-binding CsgD family transcriptional regulator/tetratricopeptide (TPR) repeat protein
MANGRSHASGLPGRRSECAMLDRLVANVRAGESRVLVLRGEAGIGKTALLDHLGERASGCRIARAAGVESEMELAFAGLHQLCAPMLGDLEHLPGPQRDALQVAFGLQDGGAPDRFLVALAALSLLAEVAEASPLVCLIDDAQWLDHASAQTLAFVARRLLAEPIAMVFAVRESGEPSALDDLPELVVDALGDADARRLLASALPGLVDERVRDRVIAEARGNPLALLELPRGLTPEEAAGGFGLLGAGPLTSRIEQSFIRRIQTLPRDSQRLLLTAAAEPIGDAALVWRAGGRLGIGPGAADAAEAAGLIELGPRVRFRHPLVRSAVYRAAAAPDRQDAHRALAEETDAEADPDRRAWHRAQAATRPDEGVAGELVQSADRAEGRGGVAAAAAFLQRATELTPDPVRRAGRALTAAQAKFDAGATEAALELLAAAEPAHLDELQRARSAHLRAQITFVRTRGADAARLLLEAAGRLDPLDPALAREAYLEALRAAIFAGRLVDDSSVETVAVAARSAPPAGASPRAMDLLLDGLATRFTEGYAAAAAPLRRALDAFWQEGEPSDDDRRWLWLACPVAPEPIAPDLWDHNTWDRLTGRAVTMAREAGALTVLPVALTARAGLHVHAGEFAAAEALVEEADGISAATGNVPLRYTSLLLAAWRGDRLSAQKLIESSLADATASGEGRAIGLAEHASAVLHNGLGEYPAALAAARRACEHEDLGFFGWSLAELVEAGVRADARDEAAAALALLEERTDVAGTSWALGMQARSRALLSTGEEADAWYREAIQHLGLTTIVVHVARAQLLYGEWLRREQRSRDARVQLRRAHETLSRIGAQAFAERAARELAATGEMVSRRTAETGDELTAQEAQVARLARDGSTNPEIGAQLFISPRTVEYHLRKVFLKLGIRSRRELRGALPDAVAATPT